MNNGNNIILAYIPPDSSEEKIIVSAPGKNIGDLTTEIYLPGENDSILKLSNLKNIAGEKQGFRRIELKTPVPISHVLPSVILAGAIRLLSSVHSDSDDRIIIFSQGLIGLLFQWALIERGLKNMVIAVDTETQQARAEGLNGGIILDVREIGFIDRLKIETKDEGFSKVVVASNQSESVKMALGCAGVFGEIYLLSSVIGSVNADLNASINYKSLVVKGHNFINHLCDLTEEDILVAIAKISGFPFFQEIPSVNWENWEESISAEDGDRFIFVQNNVVS